MVAPKLQYLMISVNRSMTTCSAVSAKDTSTSLFYTNATLANRIFAKIVKQKSKKWYQSADTARRSASTKNFDRCVVSGAR